MADFGARIASVRAKPGALSLSDGLMNALSGLGTTSDPTIRNRYAYCPLAPQEIEAAYRGSGMMRKAIKVRVMDKVRAGRDWQAKADQIEAIEAEEKRLAIKPKLYQVELLRALGGGALVLGMPGEPATPAPTTLGKQGLAFVQVVNRWQLMAREFVTDPTRPEYPGPEVWQVQTVRGVTDIHPSRLITFRGEPLPNLNGLSEEDIYWGESRVEQMLSAVENSDTAQQAFAGLIMKARSTIIGIPELSDLVSTTEGETRVQRRVATMMRLESMLNAVLRDAGDGKEGSGETIEHRQVNWAGIRDVMYAYATFVAAMADIPVTRLLGTAAEGMNASGDSQQRDYAKSISAEQEVFLEPCLDQLDAVLIPSALGSRPPEIWWQFSPLDTPTEAEEATRFKTTMEAVEKAQNTGAIPDTAFAEGFQSLMVEEGWMPGLEGALDKIGEDERFGILEERAEAEAEKLQAANENAAQQLQERGAVNADQAAALITDARERTLYVCRKLINADEFIRWAKGQGFETTTPADELHVTVCFSRAPVDWLKMGSPWDEDEKGRVKVRPGGARLVEKLGDKGAVVLMFTSSALSWRHEEFRRNGASFDFDQYQPHVTITYEAPAGLDLDQVEPFRGELVFGPEVFAEVVEDWEKGIAEA